MSRDLTRIGDLRHRVKLCTAKDVSITDGVLMLARQEVVECWAKVEERRASSFTPNGHVVDDGKPKASHYITIRWRADILFSTTAYFYEARLQSPPRWFKVMGEGNVCEASRFFKIPVRLIDRADDTMMPSQTPAEAPRPQVARPARPLLGIKS